MLYLTSQLNSELDDLCFDVTDVFFFCFFYPVVNWYFNKLSSYQPTDMHVNMLSISFAFLQKCAPYLDIIIGVLQHKGCNKQQAAAQFRWFDVTL